MVRFAGSSLSPETERDLRANHPIFAQVASVPQSRFELDGIAVCDGWAAILDDMASEIEQYCATSGTQLPSVLQVKEKFGTLCVYVGRVCDELHEIIARAETRSAQTCEICGAVGSLRSDGGWLRTRCEEHVDQPVREIV